MRIIDGIIRYSENISMIICTHIYTTQLSEVLIIFLNKNSSPFIMEKNKKRKETNDN